MADASRFTPEQISSFSDFSSPDASNFTSEQIFSFSDFSSPDDLYKHARAILSTVTSHQELVYKNVPPTWAQTTLDQLDSEFEDRCFRKNYNSITSTIWIRAMPTEIHDCHQEWIAIERGEWNRAGLTTTAEDRNLKVRIGTTITFIGGPYPNSRKEPDLLVRPDNQRVPSVVAESGWTESLPRLLEDMNLWLVGSQGQVRAVIILNWGRVMNNKVRGAVQLYTLEDGMPRLQQELTIFPAPPPPQAANQQLVLTRRQIFGAHVFPGRNPNDQFPLSIDLLRQQATDALALMNLVPA